MSACRTAARPQGSTALRRVPASARCSGPVPLSQRGHLAPDAGRAALGEAALAARGRTLRSLQTPTVATAAEALVVVPVATAGVLAQPVVQSAVLPALATAAAVRARVRCASGRERSFTAARARKASCALSVRPSGLRARARAPADARSRPPLRGHAGQRGAAAVAAQHGDAAVGAPPPRCAAPARARAHAQTRERPQPTPPARFFYCARWPRALTPPHAA
jgi:hypothetical protein